MVQTRLGLIRVVTLHDPELLHAHGRRIEEVLTHVAVTSVCIPEQPRGIHDGETEALAVNKILEQALQLESDGVDAVIVSCMADPGLPVLQQHLSIPAVGSGTAGALVALAHARPVGVLTIAEHVPAPVKRVLDRWLVASARPRGVETTLDLFSDEGREETLQAADRLRREGAQVILLGCTGMSTVSLGPEIERRTGLPVIDPVVATGVMAYYAARDQAVAVH